MHNILIFLVLFVYFVIVIVTDIETTAHFFKKGDNKMLAVLLSYLYLDIAVFLVVAVYFLL